MSCTTFKYDYSKKGLTPQKGSRCPIFSQNLSLDVGSLRANFRSERTLTMASFETADKRTNGQTDKRTNTVTFIYIVDKWHYGKKKEVY